MLSLFVHGVPGPARQQPKPLFCTKGRRRPVFEENDYRPGKNAFYIYRNCIYDLVLKNKQVLSIKVTDIRNDSIYYTSAFNHTIVLRKNWHTDTLALHPMQLKKVRLIGDQLIGTLFGTYSLTRCRYVFEKGDAPKTLCYRKDHFLCRG